MSARDFSCWCAWLEAEQIGPHWDRMRHAQIVAALHNSGRMQKKGGGLFKAADFMPPDPWAPPPTPPKPQTLAQIRAAAKRAGMARKR